MRIVLYRVSKNMYDVILEDNQLDVTRVGVWGKGWYTQQLHYNKWWSNRPWFKLEFFNFGDE